MALDKTVKARVEEWQGPDYDQATRDEIAKLMAAKDEAELVDRFYQDLDFGTGGLRGVLGAGTNRMNVYTVRKATQGLANYMVARGGPDAKRRGAVVCYDSRRCSASLALETALVLAGNGVKAYLFDGVRPTPVLSFAVRHLKAVAGVNVTASHNPPQYNGYKAYWEDGAQMTPPHDEGTIAEVRKVTSLRDVKRLDEAEARKKGLLVTVGADLDEAYYARVLGLAQSKDLVARCGKDVRIVYTPLHGAGWRAVPEMLKRYGFGRVDVVPEQATPDEGFPTIQAPNPEVKSSMQMALDLARTVKADLVLGTDADCDRLGVAIPDPAGEYRLLSGNQIGCILIDYYLRRLRENKTMPRDGVVVKTIVTTDLQRVIAEANGAECLDVLTGFKWIGRKMLEWELLARAKKPTRTYLIGGEESFGFLAGDFVRDKDAVIAAVLMAEAAVECRSKKKSLLDRLDEIYVEHGLYVDELRDVYHQGKEGGEKIAAIMKRLRERPPAEVAGSKVVERWDVKSGQVWDADGAISGPLDLPSSDVLVFMLEDGSRVTARPSGTEPKIKFYFAITVRPPKGAKGATALAAMRAAAVESSKRIIPAFMKLTEV